jgi:hypothetical protein
VLQATQTYAGLDGSYHNANVAVDSCSVGNNAQAGPSSPPPSLEPPSIADTEVSAEAAMPANEDGMEVEETGTAEKEELRARLKPLSALLWPPEPDSSIFTDPLRRDDPKPLRHEELLRIGKDVCEWFC